MANRIAGVGPVLASVITATSTQQALQGQARVSGGAANYAAQADQHAQEGVSERRCFVSKLVAKRPMPGLMAALPQANHLHKHYDDEMPERDPWGTDPRKRRRRTTGKFPR